MPSHPYSGKENCLERFKWKPIYYSLVTCFVTSADYLHVYMTQGRNRNIHFNVLFVQILAVNM